MTIEILCSRCPGSVAMRWEPNEGVYKCPVCGDTLSEELLYDKEEEGLQDEEALVVDEDALEGDQHVEKFS